MKLKKLVSALVSGAMILGTMAAVPVFAAVEEPVADEALEMTEIEMLSEEISSNEEVTDTVVAKIGENTYTSLADALNVAKSGDVIKVMEGTFESPLSINTNGITIMGSGMSSTTLKVADGKTLEINANNVVIKDLYIKRNKTDDEARAISITGNNTLLENVKMIGGGNGTYGAVVEVSGVNNITFKNCEIKSTNGGGFRGIMCWGFTGNFVIDGCSIDPICYTFNFDGGTGNIIVSNSKLYGWTSYTSSIPQVTFKNCTFKKSSSYYNWQYNVVASYTRTIFENCTFDKSFEAYSQNNDAIWAFVNCEKNGTSITSENVLELLPDIVNENDETKLVAAKIGDKYYDTLAEAVAAAQDNDTIELLSDVAILPTGEGDGDGLIPQITIDKRITLDMAGNSIGYDPSVKEKELSYTPAFFVIADGGDLTITGNGSIDCEAGGNNAYGINVKGGSLTIENGAFFGAITAVQVQQGSLIVKDGTFDMASTCKEAVPDYARYVINAIDSNWKNGTATISIEGGTFVNFDPSANPEGIGTTYVHNGYYSKANNDENNTYTVLPAEAKVIDTAKTTGAEVTLDNLHNNDAVNPTDDATYKVVVLTAPKADADAVNKAIEDSKATSTPDTNTSKAIFDISVVKTDSNGTTKDISNTITQQKVTLTLGETPKEGTMVYVYHVKTDGTVEQVAAVPADGTNKVTFTAPSFSTYAATYTASAISEDDITKNVGVAFERIGDTSEYNIVLKARDSKTINRFMSADLTFDMNVTSGAVGYTVNPAASVNLIDKGDGRYEFNLDGLTSSGATGTEITIGTVTFEGNGTVEFGVKTEGVTTNIVNTAKAANNIVDNYTTAGDGTTTGKLALNNAAANGVINETFTAPTKDLTVNIAYNNKISNNAAAYQDMTVTVSGGDLSNPIEIALGDYTDAAQNPYNVTFTGNADKSTSYTLTVADTLTKNTAYTVTVEGAGYRTARHTVTMTADKTLNFWNNVLDANNKQVIEVGARDEDKVTKNFLAGDIVKDNNINIYDLSAVVSYFGTSNDVNAASAYTRYDLNRDGKIDSKDVAYVLVSWGE